MICKWASLKWSFHITELRVYQGVARTPISILTRTVGFGRTMSRARALQKFSFPLFISLSQTEKISVFQKDYILDLGDPIVLGCENDPNCLHVNGELSIFETWGTGKNFVLLYYLLFSNSQLQANINWIWTFIIVMSSLSSWQSSERNTVPRNSMICMCFYSKLQSLLMPWSDIRCGTNPDFEVDKDGWVWPNAVKGKNCSKVVYLQVSFTLSESSSMKFRKTIFWI